jgi:hypothetical protein
MGVRKVDGFREMLLPSHVMVIASGDSETSTVSEALV